MAFRNVPIDVNIRNTKNVEGDIIKVEICLCIKAHIREVFCLWDDGYIMV